MPDGFRSHSTALVEPPSTMISVTAFSIDRRVIMVHGFRSFFTASTSTRPDSAALPSFS